MEFKVKFKNNDKSFRVGFEGIQDISDGGYERGEKAQYDLFWDTLQDYGNAVFDNNKIRFGYGLWTNETFKPKYPLNFVGNISYMFRESLINNYEELRKIDFSKSTSMIDLFRDSQVEQLGVIDTRKCTGALTQIFYGCRKLKSIDEIILADNGGQKFNLILTHCINLEKVKISGKISTLFDVNTCVMLNKESIVSIFNALSNEVTSETVKLSVRAVNKAFETTTGANDGSSSKEWNELIATKANWTVALI